MNFTWFSSAFDTDDVSFRLTTFIQMFGSLILAAGIHSLFAEDPNIWMVYIGFVVMRVGLVAQWLRVAVQSLQYRKSALTYAVGVSVMQVLWAVLLFLSGKSSWFFPLAFVLCMGELLVPVLAERHEVTPWHPHHMAERYGLLVIIVLGEGILGTLNTISNAIGGHGWHWMTMFSFGLGAMGLVFALWWCYFSLPSEKIYHRSKSFKRNTLTGYVHYFVFASMAAVGTGLELLADVLSPANHSEAVHETAEATAHHIVSPMLAMTTLSTAIFISLLSMILIGWLAQHYQKFSAMGLLSLGLSFLPVLAVYLGLPLNLAVWLAIVAPAVMVIGNWQLGGNLTEDASASDHGNHHSA